jgi:stage V sporulation protein SpoVS
MTAALWRALAFLGTVALTQAAHDILDYGAIAGARENTTEAIINARAFTLAMQAANASSTDRTVLVPGGQEFIMMPVFGSFMKDVTFQVDGNVWASQDY